MKPLIIGEAPNRTGPRKNPIAGRCGMKLATFAGLTLDEYLVAFDRENVLARYPGSAGKGAAFSRSSARRRALKLQRKFESKRTVVLLGYRTAAAFKVRAKYFQPVLVGKARVIVVPHPSGINRWYNEPRNVSKMKRYMRRLAKEER